MARGRWRQEAERKRNRKRDGVWEYGFILQDQKGRQGFRSFFIDFVRGVFFLRVTFRADWNCKLFFIGETGPAAFFVWDYYSIYSSAILQLRRETPESGYVSNIHYIAIPKGIGFPPLVLMSKLGRRGDEKPWKWEW